MRIFFIIILFLLVTKAICAQKKRALLVGVSNYSTESGWTNIHGSNDVDLIYPTLKKQGFTIKKLTEKSATAHNIRHALSSLSMSCTKGDYVYVHFSCHGQPFEDNNGDEEDGWDESVIPYDACKTYLKNKYEGNNHITDDELHAYFMKIRKAIGEEGYLCAVIDACHAGGMSRGEDEEEDQEYFCRGIKRGFSPQGKEFRPRIDAKGQYRIASQPGLSNITILEACRSYQSNYEFKQENKYYGPLSYYVNNILESHSLMPSIEWINKIKSLMDSDKRLTRQNMVYETSLK